MKEGIYLYQKDVSNFEARINGNLGSLEFRLLTRMFLLRIGQRATFVAVAKFHIIEIVVDHTFSHGLILLFNILPPC